MLFRSWKGVRSIARAVEEKNYSLSAIEFHANRLTGDGLMEHQSEGEDDEGDSGQTASNATEEALMGAVLQKITRIAIRNSTFKRETEYQALKLLRYSRTLLLHKSLEGHNETSSASMANLQAFRFADLPIELQLLILSRLAPSLSPRQRSRVFHYAADPTTLPPLLPKLTSSCLPDPGVMGFGTGKVWALNGEQSHQCGTGQCMGARNTVSCSIEASRSQWLSLMGCNRYDPQ